MLISCFYYPMSKLFNWTPQEIDEMEIDLFMEYVVEATGRIKTKKERFIDDVMGF